MESKVTNSGIGSVRLMPVQRPTKANSRDRQRRASDSLVASHRAEAEKPTSAMNVEAAAQPRHASLMELDREKTADAFLEAARRVSGLAAQAVQTPQPFVVAVLEAMALSHEHNQHCRAGLPVDEHVQQARRDIDRAIATLLEVRDCEIPARDKLIAARERLIRLGADPNKNMPRGLRHLIYGEVSKWLEPHEVQAMTGASKLPNMPRNVSDRAELVCAKISVNSLKLALEVAHRAHLLAPDNATLKARYLQRLKEAYCAMELVLNDANTAYHIADQANIDAHVSRTPENLEFRKQSQIFRKAKKEAFIRAAADLQHVASLRKSGLLPFCESLHDAADTDPVQLELAIDQLQQLDQLLAVCDSVRLMFLVPKYQLIP
jgi:hypothetical protein